MPAGNYSPYFQHAKKYGYLFCDSHNLHYLCRRICQRMGCESPTVPQL